MAMRFERGIKNLVVDPEGLVAYAAGDVCYIIGRYWGDNKRRAAIRRKFFDLPQQKMSPKMLADLEDQKLKMWVPHEPILDECEACGRMVEYVCWDNVNKVLACVDCNCDHDVDWDDTASFT